MPLGKRPMKLAGLGLICFGVGIVANCVVAGPRAFGFGMGAVVAGVVVGVSMAIVGFGVLRKPQL